jgi:hypothetical protein
MPTFVHGKNTVIKIDDSTGTLYDLSPIIDQADNPRNIGTAETTHFGSSAKEFIVGLTDSTISVQGKFDAAIDLKINQAIDALVAGTIASLSFEYSPAGTGSGQVKYTGEFIPTSYSVSSPVANAVTIKLDGQVTGARTRGTHA